MLTPAAFCSQCSSLYATMHSWERLETIWIQDVVRLSVVVAFLTLRQKLYFPFFISNGITPALHRRQNSLYVFWSKYIDCIRREKNMEVSSGSKISSLIFTMVAAALLSLFPSLSYMGISRSPLPQNNGNLPLPILVVIT